MAFLCFGGENSTQRHKEHEEMTACAKPSTVVKGMQGFRDEGMTACAKASAVESGEVGMIINKSV